MRAITLLVMLVWARVAFGDGFPVITVQPQSQTATNSNPVLSVSATDATGYQWRFNGVDIPGATDATLTITNAQSANSGYYLAIVKNAFGWVPSQMAYLAVGSGGRVPLSNQGYPNAIANYQYGFPYPFGSPITNGSAVVVAGPALDQMQPVGASLSVLNGYFNASARTLTNVAPGQTAYYRVDITYPVYSSTWTQPSRVLKLTAAAGGIGPLPATSNLYFPVYLEWPFPANSPVSYSTQICVIGETFTLTNWLSTYGDFGTPTWQWRKDGKELGVPGNFNFYSGMYGVAATLTLTNLQASDAGIYDTVVLADNWVIEGKTALSVQLTNGFGVFQSPRALGTNFVTDLLGAAGRGYLIQQSTNLNSWTDLKIVTNTSGTITITNSGSPNPKTFYRARLLP